MTEIIHHIYVIVESSAVPGDGPFYTSYTLESDAIADAIVIYDRRKMGLQIEGWKVEVFHQTYGPTTLRTQELIGFGTARGRAWQQFA
jgi:hypothetical protein